MQGREERVLQKENDLMLLNCVFFFSLFCFVFSADFNWEPLE